MEFEQFDDELLDGEQMRLENEIMKLGLEAEYGAIFPDAKITETDPEPEYNFLKRILQLHQRIANTPPRPLRDIFDFDEFDDPDAITDDDKLKYALWDLLDLLEESNIIVDFDYEYSDRTMYEFAMLELPDLEVIGRPADDEYICVLYEAFHPNIECEARDFSSEFVGALLCRDVYEYPNLYFPFRDDMYLCRGLSQAGLFLAIDGFHDCFVSILNWSLEITRLEIIPPMNADERPPHDQMLDVEGTIRYVAVLPDRSVQMNEGPFSLYLEKEAGRWWVYDFDLHGFIWPKTR